MVKLDLGLGAGMLKDAGEAPKWELVWLLDT